MKKIMILAAAALMLLPACVSRSDEKSEKAKADYGRALSDSIAIIEQQIDSCKNEIKIHQDNADVWIRDFTTVGNPREVGTYIIYTPFVKLYPLTSTGLVARINDSEQFELVAALSGGVFDQISVVSGEDAAMSAVVPHDQALNYRNSGLNTVSFTGDEADAIGKLIFDNELNPITVQYLQGGKVASSWKVPLDYVKMLSYTYALYNSTREANRLNMRVSMLHEKVNLLRAHQDRIQNQQASDSTVAE